MINSFRNFTKKKAAGLVLIIIIIIAFGFGGFGGGFNPSNQNNIVKINNTYISTQDFMDYLNQSQLSSQVIKDNIDKNILEELLSTLVSSKILDLEINDLNVIMSQDTLIKKLKKNKNFIDENGKFQRTLYEKFLLSNNLSAAAYEMKLKNNGLQKQLFNYIHGGVKPPNFLVKDAYKEENKKVFVDYINLDKFYKKSENFTEEDIKKFTNENSEKLKQDHIDFSYIIITPQNLIGLDDFNQNFFDEIDEIENKISKNIDFKDIVRDLKITPKTFVNYIRLENLKTIENIIYDNRNNVMEILEFEGQYIFYHIDEKKVKLPDLKEPKIKKQITNLLFQKEKYEFNQKILEQINNKLFDQSAFDNLTKGSEKKIQIDSIKDTNKFEVNSIEILYSLPINSFTMITDEDKNIYVAKITKHEKKNIDQNSNEFDKYIIDLSAKNRNTILKSYDYFLNEKYKVTINQKTLDRVKNYFK
jgi:peptidyl-prolyl cis-trans isomerase D